MAIRPYFKYFKTEWELDFISVAGEGVEITKKHDKHIFRVTFSIPMTEVTSGEYGLFIKNLHGLSKHAIDAQEFELRDEDESWEAWYGPPHLVKDAASADLKPHGYRQPSGCTTYRCV